MGASATVEKIIESAGYKKGTEGVFRSGREGYWSNLDKEDNEKFLAVLDKQGPIEAVRDVIPQYEDIIFSPRREAALELLDIQDGSVAIDYGCMWGVLSVGMAKRGASVIAVDQTLDSLAFLSSRSKFENLDITCVQDDIRKVQLEALADFAVVNGVLEWVPEEGDIEIKKYYGKKLAKDYGAVNPELTQMKFLEGVGKSLKEGGKLLLAIENRLDYTHFLGKPDPHVNLPFTAILPRGLANVVSKICLGRPYVNYLYSFPKIKKMLVNAGFKVVDLYAVFPDYRYPSLILPYNGGIERYSKYWPWRDISWKRKVAYSIEYVLMAVFKAQILAPSIIAVAKK